MKKSAKILFAVALVLGLSGAARAESQDKIVVSLPFSFVVGGKTLPAGTYTVRRSSFNLTSPLLLTRTDDGTSVFVLPALRENASGSMPEVTFQRAGGENFLSAVRTGEYVYQFPVSQSLSLAASARSGRNAPASGGSE